MTNAVQLINGKWLAGAGMPFQSVNPATNEVIWQGEAADEIQIDAAIQAARLAFKRWSRQSLSQRLAVIKAFAAQLTENKEAMAELIAIETGKPLWETRTEAAAMIGKIALSEKSYEQRTSETENKVPAGRAFTRHKPHGVMAVFGPYNFPGHLPNGHIVPALIAGNTVVFKPSEQTPKVAELMLQLWQKAGLPDGVINLVQGEIETGKALADHPAIDGLLFTGSSTTGSILHRHFAGQPGKVLALEMGGNNPLLVDDTIVSFEHRKAAVYHIIQSAFLSAGQRCTCARRLLVPAGEQGDILLDELVTATKAIRIAKYNAPEQPFMGSLISHQAAKSIIAAQKGLIEQGGKSLLTAQLLDSNTGFVSPGIVDVSKVKDLPDEEHFGPLLKVLRFDNFEQAIELANDTRYGLSAGLLSVNEANWHTFYQDIRAGIVNWNKPITGASGAAPFGGVGLSGNQRPSAFYAADYCAYPVASVEDCELVLPAALTPGIDL